MSAAAKALAALKKEALSINKIGHGNVLDDASFFSDSGSPNIQS